PHIKLKARLANGFDRSSAIANRYNPIMRFITLVAVVSPLCVLAAGLETAEKSITTGGLLKHIKVLASDQYEGRAPATRGEELTVQYLTEQFKAMGLKPGNPNGTYVQDVP